MIERPAFDKTARHPFKNSVLHDGIDNHKITPRDIRYLVAVQEFFGKDKRGKLTIGYSPDVFIVHTHDRPYSSEEMVETAVLARLPREDLNTRSVYRVASLHRVACNNLLSGTELDGVVVLDK